MESRLSKHSPNAKIFKKSTQVHQEALKKTGCGHKLTYQKPINNKKKPNKAKEE